MQRLVIRLYSQAMEGRQSVSIVLHDSLTMEVFITPKEPIGKRIATLCVWVSLEGKRVQYPGGQGQARKAKEPKS